MCCPAVLLLFGGASTPPPKESGEQRANPTPPRINKKIKIFVYSAKFLKTIEYYNYM